LVAAVKAAASGEGRRVVLLSGEPGIGKPTLAAAVARQAHEDGGTVLYGRCDEDVGVPYQPFVEALGGYMDDAPDAAIDALDQTRLSELARLVPQVRARIPGLGEPRTSDPEAERYLLFGAVTALLAQLSATAPVVLVIDDLHWADKPAVLLLRHLVTTLGRAKMVVFGTYRESDLAPEHPLTDALASFRRGSSIERLAVGGLDDGGVVALLESLAGHELGDDGIALAHAVRGETDGNPFFAAEVVRHLAESGAIRQEEGRWRAAGALSSIGLPESVREVVGQRVRRLGDRAHEVLSAASVVGRDFDLSLVARVADCPEDDVLDLLEAAMA